MLFPALRRLTEALFVMLGISILVFLIFFTIPGADPAARIAGRNASPETLQQVRHDFGLDRSLPVQYAVLMRRLFITRDLTSFVNRGQEVIPAIAAAAPVTLSLVAGAAVIWVVGALVVGCIAALTRGTLIDRSLMALCLVGVSTPVFWLAEMANLITQNRLHDTWLFSWVPALGYVNFADDPLGWVRALIIPCCVLASLFIGVYGRVLRNSLIEAYEQDYIRTARAKGLTATRILLGHALRTSLVGVVSLFGLDFGALVGGGAVLTEVIFGLPGVGQLTYQALQNLDLPLIMSTVVYAAFFVVLANAIVDVLYAILDPRARLAT
jgi:peptide/nickel transport system permease protein